MYNQGLKSIGNTGTGFPGRQTVGRKEEAFIMRNKEDRWYFMPKKVNSWKTSQLWFYLHPKQPPLK
jgi:hypothetical protein